MNDRMKFLGHMVDDGEQVWLLSSAAEAGFRVTGATWLAVTLRADDTVTDPGKETQLPRFEVLLDGEKVLDRRLTVREETVTVFTGTEPRDAEVRLIKLSECTQSLMALKEIETDGTIEPLPERPLKMEFIGDSITCGYGVEGKSEAETFTTATENVTKAYAFLTAEALGADAVMTCFSGHGIVSGYTGDPAVINDDELLPPYYEKEGRNIFRLPTGETPQETDRDFSAFRPDYIVLNLGTNDLSWCQADEARGQYFSEQYTAFLKTVRRNNPGARILCALGAMGTGLNPALQQAVENYRRETGDGQVRLLMLEEQNAVRDGYGADYHPSAITQRLLAEKVTDAVREWMKK